MKFIADSMLGRLARWLRLMGFDTLYFPHIEDRSLIKLSRAEGRILITRDTRLVKMRGVQDFILLNENDPFDQLKNVVTRFNLLPADKKSLLIMSRCSICNETLKDIPKDTARNKVPAYVYSTIKYFRQCPACERLYWSATHVDRMREKLKGLFPDSSAMP